MFYNFKILLIMNVMTVMVVLINRIAVLFAILFASLATYFINKSVKKMYAMYVLEK